MVDKDDRMVFRVTDEERVEVVDASLDRDITITELVKRSLKFYLGFPPGFIERMEKAAKEYETDVSTMVARLLLVYVATDKAIIDNFGVSKTYQRAFSFTPDGKLIPAEEISDKTYEEMDKVCKKFLKKLIRTAETGEDSVLTKEEATLFPMVDRGVKPEAKYSPVARAKTAKP
jgi:hypothetical protein